MAIYQEHAGDYDSDDTDADDDVLLGVVVGELFDEVLLGGHPLARPVIGSEESIRGMARDTLHDFWRSEYTTPRMVVTAAGKYGQSLVGGR